MIRLSRLRVVVRQGFNDLGSRVFGNGDHPGTRCAAAPGTRCAARHFEGGGPNHKSLAAPACLDPPGVALSGTRNGKCHNGTKPSCAGQRAISSRYKTPRGANSIPNDELCCKATRNEKPHAMKYTPSECPKCGTDLVRSPRGGQPTRWCSEGCKRSGESEMARLESLLRQFTEGKYVDQINGRRDELRDEALADMQTRYDHLAGVPQQGCGA